MCKEDACSCSLYAVHRGAHPVFLKALDIDPRVKSIATKCKCVLSF